MKTINVKSVRKIKILTNDDNVMVGFVGEVKVYDTYVYVDTRNGEGYDKIIEKMKTYINKLIYKYDLSNLGFDSDDSRQQIILHILSGIPKYNPEKNDSLTAFLHMRVERKMINHFVDLGAKQKNPTFLKTKLYSVNCTCNNSFTIAIGSDENINEYECENCLNTLEKAKKYVINKPPTHYSMTNDILSSDNDNIAIIYGNNNKKSERYLNLKHDLMKWIKNEKPIVQQLIHLVCFEDYSIRAAAKKLGISQSKAEGKLKRLRTKKIVRETFGK